MNVIWAPWRMAYVKNAHKPARCIFCLKHDSRRDAAHLVLHRGQYGFVIMNRYPYNSGHLLVAPYAHVRSLELLPADCALDLIRMTNLSIMALQLAVRPEGFNVGLNLGQVSGAGIEAHLHLHIVPRWNGDTNFMSLLAETRVIPEHLRATYRTLRTAFRSALAGRQPPAALRRVRLPEAGAKRRTKTRRQPVPTSASRRSGIGTP
ncbi:MAG: HIT domain-containing protein [Nitrospira sp.]|nr:HIT domain-containing protein [Nitrospira sp.]